MVNGYKMSLRYFLLCNIFVETDWGEESRGHRSNLCRSSSQPMVVVGSPGKPNFVTKHLRQGKESSWERFVVRSVQSLFIRSGSINRPPTIEIATSLPSHCCTIQSSVEMTLHPFKVELVFLQCWNYVPLHMTLLSRSKVMLGRQQ